MENRQHPRVSVPLIVELSHASLGQKEATAKDLSDGGVFVHLTDHKLQLGAALKVKVKTNLVNDTQHTPTVDTKVVRIDDAGVALEFKNKTALHLWSSVERLRDELAVGRDYFQVYEALVCGHPNKGVLLVQQHGKWGFPGYFLEVDVALEGARKSYLESELSVTAFTDCGPLETRSLYNPYLPETSTLCIFQALKLNQPTTSLRDGSSYKDLKWVVRPHDTKDLTVTHDWVRTVVHRQLQDLGITDK